MSLLFYFFICYSLLIAAPAVTSAYLKPLVIVFNTTAEISGYPISGTIIHYQAIDFSGKIICKTASLLPLKITTPN